MDEERAQAVSEYLKSKPEVSFAFLFGSRAKGRVRRASDWDIGVYLDSESRSLEQELWSAIERICQTSVDLVVLNRAPAHIAWNIVRSTPLVIRDRNAFLDFLLRTSHEANDWYRTAEDYHRVFARSSSLSREDRGRLEKIIQFLTVETADFSSFQKLTRSEYLTSRAKKREVERWAEQLINAAIDAAEIALASEKRVIPETYRDIVKMAGDIPSFAEHKACDRLSEWTSLRNVLAHEYLDYRWERISVFIRETEPLFKGFADGLQRFLAAPQKLGA